MSADVAIRDGETGDLGFVLVTFSKSFRDASAYSDKVPTDLLGELITAAVVKYGLRVLYEPESPSVIIGWAVAQAPGVIAWVYVDPAYRRKGAARALLHDIDPREILSPFATTRVKWHRRWNVRFRPWMALRP